MKNLKKICIGLSAGLVSLLAFASSSFAVLSADQLAVTGMIDTLISDLATWGWTAVLAMASFVVGAKLFKRFLGSAT